MKKLIAGIGECIVSNDPESELKTYALGSCVAVIFLDPKTRTAGLVHIALPDSSANKERALEQPGYFVDTGIPHLIKEMEKAGSTLHPGYMVKLIGGAHVIKDDDQFLIGERNVNAAKKLLWQLNLPLTSSDVGDRTIRTVTVSLKTGKLIISSSTGQEWSI